VTPYVAVCGAGMAAARPADLHAAEDVGRRIADAGGIVVCGGLRGVMEAACRGARSADGITVGLLPGADRGAANPFVSVAIPTGMGELRNGLVVRAADVVIAIGGEWGTLSEIALAIKTGTPVVGIDTWDLEQPGIEVAADAGAAVERALTLARGR
jgi:uncharacterized protein (TIGR00725 family)